MCLAIFKPKNLKIPDRSIIERAWISNPDGAGISIRHDNHVEIIKGIMTLDELQSILYSGLLEDHDVFIHLRYSTSGSIIPGLTHPFPLSNKNDELLSTHTITDQALVHNGVLFSPLFKDYSDTAIFSRYLKMTKMDDDTILNRIGSGNKIGIMTPQNVRLIGQWILHEDGLSYSNDYSLRDYSRLDFTSRLDDPFWFKDDSYFDNDDYNDFDDLICPCCGHEEVEYIGLKTKTFECLRCNAVFNDQYFILNKVG